MRFGMIVHDKAGEMMDKGATAYCKILYLYLHENKNKVF
jgi:hypothetical protein